MGAAGIAATAAIPATVRAAPSRRRNVLLLISDDQGLDLGCYGVPISTPRLDGFAKESTRFTQAYTAVSSCSSSRAVINTGLYTHQNGMYGLAHDEHHQSVLDGIDTLPQMLKRAGYATAIVGKKHLKPDSAFSYDLEIIPKSGIRDVKALADTAASFIRSSSDKPFFVTVGYGDPHRGPGGVGYGNERQWPNVTDARYDPSRVPLPAHLPDLPEVRQDLADYYQSISRLDSGVGMLLDALAQSGHADDTLVIFLSDNGRPFPGAKTNLYDPGLHLPLIVRAPGAKAAVCDAMVSWVDIAPTILDFAGAKPPSYPLPGRSLLSIVGTAGAAGWDDVVASHEFHEIYQYYPMRALRTRTHSYIQNLAHPLDYPVASDVAGSASWQAIVAKPDVRLGGRTQAAFRKRPAEELYDLTSDPNELVNLAGRPEMATLQKQMRDRLTDILTKTNDPWLVGQPNPYLPLPRR